MFRSDNIRIPNGVFNRRTCYLTGCNKPGTHYVLDKHRRTKAGIDHVLDAYCSSDADSWRKDGYGVRIRGAIDTAAELEW